MTGYIGCFGLIAIFGFIVMLAFWSRGKRKEVNKFYNKYSLFSTNDAPELMRQAISAPNAFCLRGNLTNISGDAVPFYWWEWTTNSTIYGGAAPVTTFNCFLAISFLPNVTSEEFEQKANLSIQSKQAFSQKLKDGIVLNTHNPVRTEKLADGSFIIFWQITKQAKVMEEKINWLKENVTVKRTFEEQTGHPAPQNLADKKSDLENTAFDSKTTTKATFYTCDNYTMLKRRFNEAWKNLQVEIHHSGHKLWKEGWDEYDDETISANSNSQNEIIFTLTGETTARDAINLFVKHFGGEAFILRNGISVEDRKTLDYCNNP